MAFSHKSKRLSTAEKFESEATAISMVGDGDDKDKASAIEILRNERENDIETTFILFGITLFGYNVLLKNRLTYCSKIYLIIK